MDMRAAYRAVIAAPSERRPAGCVIHSVRPELHRRHGLSASLEALLEHLVDYAGLFPPAELPLREAVRNFGAYRASTDAWMLGRFICPAGRLEEAAPLLLEHVRGDEPARLSVLLRGGVDAAAFLATMEEDLERVSAFLAEMNGRAVVDAFEVKFPAGLLAAAAPGPSRELIDAVASRLAAGPAPAASPFYEAGFGSQQWPTELSVLAQTIGDHDAARAADTTTGTPPAGFKLRCGGVTDDAFPSTEQIAFAIAACRDHAVPMKFTAGLHHPFRHFNDGQQVTMHGFLNVFTATVLAWSQKLPAPRIQQVLDDTSPASFVYDDQRLSWKGYTVPADDVAALRAAAVSFGSCSFDEPREDLRALGLMPPA